MMDDGPRDVLVHIVDEAEYAVSQLLMKNE